MPNKTHTPRIPPHIVALMMLQALEYNMTSFEGVHDPATQAAIDWMANSMYTDRPRLLNFLRDQFNDRSDPSDPGRSSLITEALLNAWTDNKKLKKSTGRTSTFGGAAERAVELSLQRSEGVTIVMNDEDGTNYVTIFAKVETQYAGYSRRGERP